MKRAAILAAVLLVGEGAELRGTDTTYRMKVMLVDHGAKRLEAKFTVVPEDMRLVCHGEAKEIYVGDYAKVEFKEGKFMIAGTVCTEVAWLK